MIAGVLAFLAAAPAARAEYDIVISASSLAPVGGSIDINVFDPTLNTSTDPNVIAANITNLNIELRGILAGFTFTGLSVSKTPLTDGTQQLNVIGTIVSDPTAGTAFVGPVTITASAVDYSFPTGGAALMTSTASDSFAGGFGGRTFQSFFDAGNAEFATTTPSPLLSFASGTGSSSRNGTAADTPVGITGLYSLTNTTVVSLVSGENDLFTGVTTIRAVPEPGSMALVLVGGTALVARLRRRKIEA
jgi:hypothetical protein